MLPLNEETREDFQWIAREIVQDGGEATVCDAMFVEGMQNEHVEALFRHASASEWRSIVRLRKRADRAL